MGITDRAGRTIGLLLGLLVLVSVAAIVHRSVEDGQRERTSSRLHDVAELDAQQLEADVVRWADLLGTVNGLDVAALDRPTFELFVDRALGDRDGSGGLSGTYGGMSSYSWVTDHDGHHVVAFARPAEVADRTVGHDLGTQPERREAFAEARDRGVAVVTSFSGSAVGSDRSAVGTSPVASVVVPVYDGADVPSTVDERRLQILGWAVGDFEADALVGHLDDDAGSLVFELLSDGRVVGRTGELDGSEPTSAEVPVAALDREWALRVAAVAPLGNIPVLERAEVAAAMVAALGLAVLAAVEVLIRWRVTERRRLALVSGQVDALARARRQTADQVRVGLLDIDPGGVVRWSNPVARELLELDSADLHDRSLGATLLESGQTIATVRDLAAAGYVTDGTELVLSSGSRLDLMSTPEPGGSCLVTVTDVTEVRNTIDELAESLDEAVEARHHGERLLATLSHEVRTPLAGIVGLAELGAEAGSPDAPAGVFGRIRTVGTDLLEIVEDALAITAAETGRLSASPTAVRLSDFLTDLLDHHRPDARPTVDLRSTVEDLDVVLIDSARTRQILGNLVQNALRHTQDGEVVVSAGRVTDGWIRFSVADTGPGISPSDSARVFEPFLQGSGARPGSAGLGLSVVRSLVEMLGGHIRLDSRVGAGTDFVIELPAEEVDPDELRPQTDLTDHADAWAGRRVVIVDDDPVAGEVAQRQLERLGASAERIVDGDDALERMAGLDADAVLVDLHLPGADAFDVVAAAVERRDAAGPLSVVLAVTASTDPVEHERCRSLGADAVLVKPVAKAVLASWAPEPPAADVGDPSNDVEHTDAPFESELLDEQVELLAARVPELRSHASSPEPGVRRMALRTLAGSLRVVGADDLAREADELSVIAGAVPGAVLRARSDLLFAGALEVVDGLRHRASTAVGRPAVVD